ncbi:hypothetical protein [Streptomyces sp. Cmuel-A718b]|uniref:hypothetical protein n=1 Tax=Streptomyces sp. Cmuel-A718b TaxID=697328 RepID=UPI00081ED11F|nr:hypothetical protein [Streptomyces sp. Cmuel-A718b]SCF72281.1 hypothetical protein GA0115280_108714 [Streptomyces sp. Cmuel-A718b]
MTNLQETAKKLTLAGVSLLKFITPREMIRPAFAWEINALTPESGRVDSEIPRTKEGYISHCNAAWFAMAEDLHVINGEREFLLAIENDLGDIHWSQVSLAKEWDFIGVGSALGVTGSREGFPSFALMSIDGNSALVGHSNDTSVSFTGAARLKEIPELREYATRLAFHSPHLGHDAAFSAKVWLGLDPSE